jgi:uncharacterized repeat protein (TIGR01451 family)
MNARTKSLVQQLGTALAVLFLGLALLSLLAYVQGPTPAGASDPALAGPALAATPDCAHPPTGQKAKIVAEDEIGIVVRAKNKPNLELVNADNSGQNLVWGSSWLGTYDRNDIRWPAITMADLNGDGKQEPVMAFRDKQNRLAVTTAGDYEWYADVGDWHGDNVQWVDIAAGDMYHSGMDRVVVAFADNNNDIHMVGLSGTSDGKIAQGANGAWAQYHNDQGARGDVKYVAVATGDLTGSGYKDHVVTAFKDGNGNLQAIILERGSDAWYHEVWHKAWTDHDRGDVAKDCSGMGYSNVRPIDVTTGDIDGDKKDEVILAFRSGPCYSGGGYVQLLVLDYQSGAEGGWLSQETYDSRVWTQRHAEYSWSQGAVTAVSVSAADLDGDGTDEIALGYTVVYSGSDARWWQQHLVSYKWTPQLSADASGVCFDDSLQPRPCLEQRSGSWNGPSMRIDDFGDSTAPPARVAIATGDLDMDGMAEIVLMRRDKDSGSTYADAYVMSFDADNGLSLRTSKALTWSGADSAQEFGLAMGDTDGNSRWATYSGTCYEQKGAQIMSVIYAPPSWPGKNKSTTKASYGNTTSGGGGDVKTAQSSIGGSVKLKATIPLLGGITPSFTHDWEKTTVVQSKEITKTASGTSFSVDQGNDGIQLVETTYWCYDYTAADIGTMPVCIPQGTPAVYSYNLSWWNTTGKTMYPDSWVPINKTNLAQGMTATQSSVSTWGGPANLAVDGNTDGNFSHGSVTHTGYDSEPWWQVDLGSVQQIDSIELFNRTDCCQGRLGSFYVFVSDVPFTSNSVAGTLYQPGVWYTFDYNVAPIQLHMNYPVNRTGRYVRVQIVGTQYLSLAEVQVWGGGQRGTSPNELPSQAPVKTGDNTFQLTWRDGHTTTVNGDLVYTRQGSVIGVNKDSLATSFNVGFNETHENLTEGWSSEKNTLGMETKFVAGSAWQTSITKHGFILTWSTDTTFSGQVSGASSMTTSEAYTYAPYVWLQRATSSEGTKQSFLVLDYWVPTLGAYGATPPPVVPGEPVTPTVPLIASPTHPDPATWYVTSTAMFTWTQPADDPAAVYGYNWFLDQTPDTVPDALNMGLTTAYTYTGLADGVWYMHVRAVGANDQWSDTAHRTIHVDAHAPQVSMTLDPALPSGNNGWYRTPLTVSVAASDGAGSGLAAVEVSTDGVTWQPYTAPLPFTTDTAATTVWARASDAAGNASTPVSTTFKIDMTPPTSHVSGGQGPGAWVATVITNSLGNSQLTLAGAITDALSGRAGLDLGFDNLDWTSANPIGSWYPIPGYPDIEVNWYFTTTTELGRGNHIFYGRAIDQAGNLEAPYEIARIVWLPTDSPDLSGSSLTASPTTVRPGEAVTFTLVARNGGYQEALVAVTDTLPAGLTLITDTLSADVGYDPATGIVTWPARLLWPGEFVRYNFQARAAADLPATSLVNQATAHAFWPNTESLPAEQRQVFLDHERTVVVSATVAVNPDLAASTDVTPPWASLTILTTSQYKQIAEGPEVVLSIVAAPDARWMYVREWTPDPTTGMWTVAQSSGWIGYSPSYTWTLSAGQGVKYLGVWVADGARNVSVLDEGSLAFVNRIDGSQVLADRQRVQYRGNIERGSLISAYLTTVTGDPDLYVWRPFNAFRPDLYSNDTVAPGEMEGGSAELVQRGGRYLMDIQAVGDSEYRLAMAGQPPAEAAANALAQKERPAHPLTISDPLSAGRVGTPGELWPYKIYLPILIKNR